jgi:hypothetical protein
MNIVPVAAFIHLRLSVRRRRADRATNLGERFHYLRSAHGLNILAKRGVSSGTEAATVAHHLGLLRGA